MSQSTSVLSNHVPADNASDIGRMNFIIRSALSGLRTAIPVKVMSVTNAGGISPIGTVSVQPMVSAIDGSGQVWEHGIIYNVPYMRIQGGSNGIILDPVVGDIGIATICDRDISTVKSAKKVSAPGSNRKNDMSDMVYLMTIIGSAPTQYVQFSSAGITISSPTAVTISAPAVTVSATTLTTSGTWNHTGTLTTTGNIIGSGVGLNTHHHTGVQTGGGNTGGPTG